jgi:hypothetical protein
MVFENVYTKYFRALDPHRRKEEDEHDPQTDLASESEVPTHPQPSSRGAPKYPQIFTTIQEDPPDDANIYKHDWGNRGYPTFHVQVPRPHLSIVTTLKYPTPSISEVREAIAKVSAAMAYIWDKYGLIGDSAIASYADYFGLPQRVATKIDLVIRPDLNIKIRAKDITEILCSIDFSDHFTVKGVLGVNIPQVRVMRGDREVLLDVVVSDHYTWAEKRQDYDLNLPNNKRICVSLAQEHYGEIDGQPNGLTKAHSVLLLSAPWMLRQEILTWNEKTTGLHRERAKMDIITLCDVLNASNQTLKLRSRKDIQKLTAFLKEFDNDPMVLGSVIDCPEAFGRWYELKWVRRTFAGFLFLAVPLAFDYLTSTTDYSFAKRIAL